VDRRIRRDRREIEPEIKGKTHAVLTEIYKNI
jgi:hypothetical protein